MRVYELTAPYHEIGCEALFLGFADVATARYVWVQRLERSETEVLPEAGNVWIERDDQKWGGLGGMAEVVLRRDALAIRLTPDRAAQMGGFDELRVRLSLTDEQFSAVSEQLRRVFIGYEPDVPIIL